MITNAIQTDLVSIRRVRGSREGALLLFGNTVEPQALPPQTTAACQETEKGV